MLLLFFDGSGKFGCSKEQQRRNVLLKTMSIEAESLDILRAMFGVGDSLVKIIEKKLGVSVLQRDSSIVISGDNERNIMTARDVLSAMRSLLEREHTLNADTVHRLLDEAEDGILEQNSRIPGDVVALNSKNVPIRTKTMGQKEYVKALKENTVTICIGPAGTGKTYLAVAYAAQQYRDGKIDRIILSRPAIEAGEKLGFLPGDLQEKVDPYLRPLYDALNDVFGVEQAGKLRERNIIEVAPLAYMRGRTLSNSIIIIDEGQNATLPILKMALTRIGVGSKMILTGDVTQIDLADNNESGLQKCANILKNVDDIANITLNNRDVVRCKIVKDIVKAFEKEEAKAEEKRNRSRVARQQKMRQKRGKFGSKLPNLPLLTQ